MIKPRATTWRAVGTVREAACDAFPSLVFCIFLPDGSSGLRSQPDFISFPPENPLLNANPFPLTKIPSPGWNLML